MRSDRFGASAGEDFIAAPNEHEDELGAAAVPPKSAPPIEVAHADDAGYCTAGSSVPGWQLLEPRSPLDTTVVVPVSPKVARSRPPRPSSPPAPTGWGSPGWGPTAGWPGVRYPPPPAAVRLLPR